MGEEGRGSRARARLSGIDPSARTVTPSPDVKPTTTVVGLTELAVALAPANN